MQAECLAVFLDISKFFDNVDLYIFLTEAGACGLQWHYAVSLAASWGAWRLITVEGCTSALFLVHGSILAGCSGACT